jgi:hypothetical protein
MNNQSRSTYESRPQGKFQPGTIFVLALALLMAGLSPALQACVVANAIPTVCVNLQPNCKAQIVIKGYSTYAGASGSQFCSCAFKVVPAIASVDSVEIRICSASNSPPCSFTGSIISGFDDGTGTSSFAPNNLVSSFFNSAANPSPDGWQGFFSEVYDTIPTGQCVDLVFYVTLQPPCSIAALKNDLANGGQILGASSADANGQPNGGHLSFRGAAVIGTTSPSLSIKTSGNHFIISWPGGIGTLESADNVTGPWAAVPGASSPYNATNGGREFYRLTF